MQFEFEVGDREKHKVSYHYNEFLSSIHVRVDGAPVFSNTPKTVWNLVKALLLYNPFFGLKSPNLYPSSGFINEFGFDLGTSEHIHIEVRRTVDLKSRIPLFANTNYYVSVNWKPAYQFQHIQSRSEKLLKVAIILLALTVLLYFSFRNRAVVSSSKKG